MMIVGGGMKERHQGIKASRHRGSEVSSIGEFTWMDRMNRIRIRGRGRGEEVVRRVCFGFGGG